MHAGFNEFLERYKPKSLDETVGGEKSIFEITKFINSRKLGQGVMVCGSEGTGKSLYIELVSRKLGLQLMENPKENELEAIKHTSLFSFSKKSKKGRIVVLEEPSASLASKFLSESPFPVVIVTNDPYQQKYSNIRRKCTILKIERPRYDIIASYLEKICKKENIGCEASALIQLARMSGGDMRGALIDLYVLSFVGITVENTRELASRDQQEDIFQTMKVIFNAHELENVLAALEKSDKSPEDIFWWLEGNIFRTKKSIAAYDYIAISDLMNARIIKRQAYSLQKYYRKLPALGACVSGDSSGFVRYQPPSLFRIFGVSQYRRLLPVLKKIAAQTHTAPKDAVSYLKIAAHETNPFGLDNGELEIIRNEK